MHLAASPRVQVKEPRGVVHGARRHEVTRVMRGHTPDGLSVVAQSQRARRRRKVPAMVWH